MKEESTSKRTELQRLLSKRGLASRTKAAALIRDGKVTLNGKVVTDPLLYVSLNATIAVEGERSLAADPLLPITIAFHKPRGVVTTSSDEQGRTTVFDLLPPQYRDLRAVGRLDMASSGLLLFTNDNLLADALLDPVNKIPRTYVVTLRGRVKPETVIALKSGIRDGGEFLEALDVELRKESGKESILIITLTEGKNREIRRMCSCCGHEVMKLKRISFGNIKLADLAPGAVRELSVSTLAELALLSKRSAS